MTWLIWWIWAVVFVLFSGIAYRIAAQRLEISIQNPIKLPFALNAYPVEVGNWFGRTVPIPYNIQQVAGNDDFLSRLYTNQLTKDQVNLYIAYSASPRTMLGHKPEKCYTGSGWTLENKESSTVVSSSGAVVPCLIHRFRKTVPEIQEIVVLNYYILNGQITSDESNFSGVGWRTPNIAGDPARYVAQVQISSVLENSVRMAAIDMTELILGYFPDKNGQVRAAGEVVNIPTPALENSNLVQQVK
jgi:EpsI family protein